MRNKGNTLVIFVIMALVFSEILASFFPFLSYADELLATLALYRIIFRKNKKNKDTKKLLYLLVALLLIGFVSNLLSGLNTNMFAVIVDAFTTVKAFLIMIGFNDINLLNSKEDGRLSLGAVLVRLLIIVAFVCLIFNIFGFVNMTELIRYGLKEYKFIFVNAGSFGYYMMALIPLLKRGKRDNVYIFMLLTIIASTLKGPQLIFVFLYSYYSFLRKIKSFKKVEKLFLPLAAIAIVLISGYQIDNYLINSNSARYILTEKSIITANSYFPIGSGFATYGSEMSKRYYSPLYIKYGFDTIYGLGGESVAYLNDNYWQMIIAQLGYIGLLVNTAIIIVSVKIITKKTKSSPYSVWSNCMLASVIIGSLGSAYITGCVFSTIVFIVCVLEPGDGDEK